MKIEHMALWCRDIERTRAFYETWFGAQANTRYENARKGFSSYFMRFGEGARIELMQRTDVVAMPEPTPLGYAHFALSLGSETAVDTLTARMREAGVVIADGPRRTGDGYYESVVLDPDGNRIELTT